MAFKVAILLSILLVALMVQDAYSYCDYLPCYYGGSECQDGDSDGHCLRYSTAKPCGSGDSDCYCACNNGGNGCPDYYYCGRPDDPFGTSGKAKNWFYCFYCDKK